MLHFLVNIIILVLVIFNDIVMVEKKEKIKEKIHSAKLDLITLPTNPPKTPKMT